jgi:hypothetical protein
MCTSWSSGCDAVSLRATSGFGRLAVMIFGDDDVDVLWFWFRSYYFHSASSKTEHACLICSVPQARAFGFMNEGEDL